MDDVSVSFVILTWNSAPYIETCLRSVRAALLRDRLRGEVLIVDNGSEDKTREIVKGLCLEFPDFIRVIELDHNAGTTRSRNLAFRKVSGEYVAVIDSDIEFPEEGFALAPLIAALKDHETIGLVAPRLLYPSGMLQKSTDHFPTVWSKLFRYFFLKVQERRAAQDEVRGGEVDYAISAFWLLKREVLRKVGMLDERIFYAPEDVDYCLRIWKAGYRIVYVPEVYAIHYAQEISRAFRINQATVRHIQGLIYFFNKHKYWFVKPRFYPSLTD